MAKRDSAPPADGSATGERSIREEIYKQRDLLFDVQAMIQVAHQSIGPEEPAAHAVYRVLTVCDERLDEIATELDSIAANAEVGHG